MTPISAASLGLAAWLAWRSRPWPLIHDAPLMHYVAWLLAQGAVPYRDVFDMNLPGVYLLHRAVLRLGGAGDAAWRALDLLWLALAAALLWLFARPVAGRGGALAGALFFVLYHLAGGAWHAGQRDFLLAPLLLAGLLGLAWTAEGRAGIGTLAATGLLLGVAATVKPTGLLFLAGGVAAAAARPGARSRGVAAAAVTLGGLAAPGAVGLWLAWRGGLGPFVEVMGGYVLPLYGPLRRVWPWEGLGWYPYAWPVLLLLAALALAGARRAGGLWAWRRGLAAGGVAGGLVHWWLQGKGWEYHLYPLVLFLCALAAPAPGRPVDRYLAPALAGLLVAVLAAKGADALDAPWIAQKQRRVEALVRDLGPLVPPGATVQVMDTTGGGIHALLRLGLRQPTRFLYDFHFFHDVADPRVQALRAEFVAGLAAGRPAAVVVFRDDWLHQDYGRLAGWPEVRALLAERYRLAAEGDGYRVYAERRRP